MSVQRVISSDDSSISSDTTSSISNNYSLKKFTIVTSLIDIDRGSWKNIYKRDINLYFFYLSRLLYLDCNFYIYIDDRYIDLLNRVLTTSNKDPSTVKIVPIKITDLYMNKYRDQMANIMKEESYSVNIRDKQCPEVTVPEYNIVVNSKVDLVYRATLDNVFGSSHFIWMDAGYGHGKVDVPKNFYPQNLLTDKIELLCLRDPSIIDDDYKTFFDHHIDVINGGIWSCNIDNIKEYRDIYYNVIDEYINADITDDDQYTVSMVYKKYPHIFNVHIKDSWYCAFELFNKYR